MKIAVFGGSFDPVHRGHVAVADAVQAALAPDLLLWIPARQAPHKPDAEPAPAEDRAALVEIAVARRAGERVCRSEVERPGPSYTVDTLEELAAAHPGSRLLLVLGADSLSHLASWRSLDGIFSRAELVLVPRPGWGPEQLEAFRRGLPPATGGRLRAAFLAMDPVEVSSTEIRRLLAAGEPCGERLPPGVEREIRRRCLYRQAS